MSTDRALALLELMAIDLAAIRAHIDALAFEKNRLHRKRIYRCTKCGAPGRNSATCPHRNPT